MDQLPGCKSDFRRSGICCWTISGAITSAVGFLWPIVLMVWNFIWQPVSAIFCGCCFTVGQLEACLFPVWFCSKAPCACGSCAVLGTTWLNVVTFAGFTGAAWYILIGNLVIVAGLVLFLIALLFWANSCRLEASEAPDPDEKPLVSDELTEIDLEAPNTGALKF